MLFAIQNMKKVSHTICRPNGIRLSIKPGMFVIFDTENDNEITYWLNINPGLLSGYGIRLITNEPDIRKISSSCICDGQENIGDTSIISGSVSPMVEDIASITYQKSENDEPNEESDTYNGGSYTEEELSQMSKEDLFNICDNFNIPYKRNNSVKTLVALILGSDKI